MSPTSLLNNDTVRFIGVRPRLSGNPKIKDYDEEGVRREAIIRSTHLVVKTLIFWTD